MRNVRVGLLAAMLMACVALPAQAAGPKPGEPAPTLLGKDRKGKPVDLAEHRGKVVVLTFWASWCGYCLKELPVLDALQKHAGDKVQVVAVNVKDDNDDYRLMMRQMKDYTIAMTRDRDGAIADGYGVTAYPNLWIIDREGRVAANHRGYGEDSLDRILDSINAVLARPATPGPAAAPAMPAG